MAKNVKINGVTYENVPQVEIPLADNSGNSAVFFDTGAADAAAGDILSGKTAYGASGSISGSMTDNGTVSGTISTVAGTYTIPAGKHSGSGSVSIDSTEQGKIISKVDCPTQVERGHEAVVEDMAKLALKAIEKYSE